MLDLDDVLQVETGQLAASAELLTLPACMETGVPIRPLAIELTWDGARADLDIQLRRAPTDRLNGPDTVNTCNSAPPWREQPTLNLDDLGGYGPEAITLARPLRPYGFGAYYFEAHGDGDVMATLSVRQGTATLWTATESLMPNGYWHVGLLLPDGQVVEGLWPAPTDLSFECGS